MYYNLQRHFSKIHTLSQSIPLKANLWLLINNLCTNNAAPFPLFKINLGQKLQARENSHYSFLFFSVFNEILGNSKNIFIPLVSVHSLKVCFSFLFKVFILMNFSHLLHLSELSSYSPLYLVETWENNKNFVLQRKCCFEIIHCTRNCNIFNI